MKQLSFLDETTTKRPSLARTGFSHGEVAPATARRALEEQYGHLLEETNEFNRQLVSFQANKTEMLHGWIKYREGFSADLVENLIGKFGIGPGDTILDPFAGSCTTLLVAQVLGLNAVGIELLPHCHLAWEAKSRAFGYDVVELRRLRALVAETMPPPVAEPFPHVYITLSAFPEQTERDLMAYTRWVETLDISDHARVLCRLILTSILEPVSYTRQDGQYLRWDSRALKIRERNQQRVTQGKKPTRGIDKGQLPSVKETLVAALDRIIVDVRELQREPPPPSNQRLIAGNTLHVLPEMEAEQFAGVITSPPYANRYDYTRTYALELAYLNVGEKIFDLRQRLLSCTVESRSKSDELGTFYRSIGQHDRYVRTMSVVQENEALAEVEDALRTRNKRGEINNRGVLPMIGQYFTELALVFAELHRVCRRGAHVAFVNDNVRYAGEIIPIDLLSTNLAEQVGFEPVKVYVLPQRKGNSSQQMGRYGRAALRKSITIWRKS